MESVHLGKKVTCPHCGELFVVAPPTPLGEARAKMGFSLKTASEMVGTSIRDLGRIERGLTHPRVDLARKIAGAYHSTIDELWPPSAEAVDTEEEGSEDVPDAGTD